MTQRYGLTILLLVALNTDAFTSLPPLAHHHQRTLFVSTTTTFSLQMAGFGASSSSSPKKKGGSKKATKLKPRSQWDRYISDELKDSEVVRVAVKVVETASPAADDVSQQWFEVGRVKSKDNAYTEAAVIRHRLLIADHARRIFPLQILAKDKLEWGYSTTTDMPTGADATEWEIAGKLENMPDDIDKLIGFKGLADPTGFYESSKSDVMVDNKAAGYENMKKKGITGHCGYEIHD